MADVADLIKFAQSVIPVVTTLVKSASANGVVPDLPDGALALSALRRLVSQSNSATVASVQARIDALVATRAALTETLVTAASGDVALKDVDARTISVLLEELKDDIGRLNETAALADIPSLLTPLEQSQITASLAAADSEIQQRQNAKRALDTVVAVIIAAASIAAKLA